MSEKRKSSEGMRFSRPVRLSNDLPGVIIDGEFLLAYRKPDGKHRKKLFIYCPKTTPISRSVNGEHDPAQVERARNATDGEVTFLNLENGRVLVGSGHSLTIKKEGPTARIDITKTTGKVEIMDLTTPRRNYKETMEEVLRLRAQALT